MALTAGPVAVADTTYTNQFRGDGGSSFGFAWMYARRDAQTKAMADGFTDPAHQCKEIFAFGSPYIAMVIWECTRQV